MGAIARQHPIGGAPGEEMGTPWSRGNAIMDTERLDVLKSTENLGAIVKDIKYTQRSELEIKCKSRLGRLQ